MLKGRGVRSRNGIFGGWGCGIGIGMKSFEFEVNGMQLWW